MAVDRIATLQKLVEYLIWRQPDPLAYFQVAPELPSNTLDASRIYASREKLLAALPKGGKVAEVGTFEGYFSRRIAEDCAPDEFHLIDVDFGPFKETLAGNVTKHQGDSSTILHSFPEGYFDWIYVDGDHSYKGVVKDLEAAHRAIKSGGHLMCNDYTNWMSLAVMPYGVMKAVNELIIREQYIVEGLGLSPYSNPDILIRKP
jgi:hypothetical protein